MRIVIAAGVISMLLAGHAAAATAPCSAPEQRQLDFWVGEWKVFVAGDDKTEIASSSIEKIVDGCAIREIYRAPKAPGGAYGGTSYSGYDSKDGKWHQMYVDTNGNVTWYTGGREGADMVLTAPAKGGTVQSMTYHPRGDGSVEQIGKISSDAGQTWQPGYDYVYRK